MSLRYFALALSTAAPLLAGCQTSGSGAQSVAQAAAQLTATPYAAEDKDWGIPPQGGIRKDQYHAPTPMILPGVKLVTTNALAQSFQGTGRPVIINVLTGSWVNAVPDSVWLSGAGQGTGLDDPTQARLARRLAALTAGDKAKPVVFYCLSSQCWLSYNAALRAQQLGYTNVGWYRGGVEAWQAAGLPVERNTHDQW